MTVGQVSPYIKMGYDGEPGVTIDDEKITLWSFKNNSPTVYLDGWIEDGITLWDQEGIRRTHFSPHGID